MGLTFDAVEMGKGAFRLAADFHVEGGSRLAVIGPSGAGKSTLFDAIAGFLEPMSGRIFWDEVHLNNQPPGQRPIAMLFQDNNLFPHLDVSQNVGLALTHKRRLTGDQRETIDSVLGRVGLSGMSNRRLSELSGGQLSRVALARLLLQDRPLWLLDEPFAALGPGLKQEMIALVEEFAADVKATVLMITHDPKDALKFANQSLLVMNNKVEGPVETKSLIENPPEELKSYFGN